MKLPRAGWLAVGLLLTLVAASPAAVYVAYDASLPSPNPVDQGWSVSGTPVGPAPAAGSEVIGGVTHPYWHLSNQPPAAEPFSVVYRRNFTTSEEFSDPAGWTISATLRVTRAPYAATYGHNVRLRLADGASDWHFNLYASGDGNGVFVYVKPDETNATLSTEATAADYFTFQFYYNPATASVQAYYNGTEIGSPIARSQVATTASRFLMWGDADSSARTGHYTDAYWQSVRFESGNVVVPEPGMFALVAAAGGALLIWRRKR